MTNYVNLIGLLSHRCKNFFIAMAYLSDALVKT